MTPLRQQICMMIGNGMLLSEVLELDGMPARPTIYRWLRDDQEFAQEYALAREQAADCADERIAELVREVTPANATAIRTKIAALQWRCAKLHPQRYGGSATLAIESGDAPAVDIEGARNRLLARFDEIADRVESFERSHHFVSRLIANAARVLEERQALDVLLEEDRALIVATVVQAITPPGTVDNIHSSSTLCEVTVDNVQGDRPEPPSVDNVHDRQDEPPSVEPLASSLPAAVADAWPHPFPRDAWMRR